MICSNCNQPVADGADVDQWGDPLCAGCAPPQHIENTTDDPDDEAALLELDPREAAMNAWDGERPMPREVL